MKPSKRTKKLVSQDIRIVTAALNPKDTARVGDNSVAVACLPTGVLAIVITGLLGRSR